MHCRVSEAFLHHYNTRRDLNNYYLKCLNSKTQANTAFKFALFTSTYKRKTVFWCTMQTERTKIELDGQVCVDHFFRN